MSALALALLIVSGPPAERPPTSGPMLPMGECLADNLPQFPDLPVLPPLPEGTAPDCEGPPDQRTILRQLWHESRSHGFGVEVHRHDIAVITELLVDKLESPRHVPRVGLARAHRCSWKCTVTYTETTAASWPFPFTCVRRRAEVVYLDRDRLFRCSSRQEALEAKLDRILEKLDRLERRIDAAECRTRASVPERSKLPLSTPSLENQLAAFLNNLLGFPLFNVYSEDSHRRCAELLLNSEDLRTIERDWERIWYTDQASDLAPERVAPPDPAAGSKEQAAPPND